MRSISVTARPATGGDVPDLLRLYGELQSEMVELHSMWPLADGLPEPIDRSFESAIEDPDAFVYLGLVEDVPFGFLLARIEDILPQGSGERVGAIRLIFVEQEAREVAVGEVMRDTVMARLRERGISKFDAHVLPGHRLAKNFFESGGFSARSIVMHHDDER